MASIVNCISLFLLFISAPFFWFVLLLILSRERGGCCLVKKKQQVFKLITHKLEKIPVKYVVINISLTVKKVAEKLA